MHQYEAIKGYSTPVVRVFDAEGTVLFTASFTTKGAAINPHAAMTPDMAKAAWSVWKTAQRNPTTGKVSRWLPPRFIRDTIDSNGDVGAVLNWKGPSGRCLLESTPEQYRNLRARAEAFATMRVPDEASANERAAARSLLRRMDAITAACKDA